MQTTSPPRGGLRKRLFAWMNAQGGDAYERAISARKRALFGALHGDVLEIGPGDGPNLRYYAPDVRWTGVEPNPYMYPYLQQTMRALGRPPETLRVEPGDPHGVRLPAADASMDAVVSTLVLCSVANPEDSLQEILRVLKPGGRFVFIEHVAAPRGTRLRRWQNLIQPLWSLVGDGCHPNRETWETISAAGFSHLDIEHFSFREWGLAGPHIAGSAQKAA